MVLTAHLIVNKLDESLTPSQNPAIHDVGGPLSGRIPFKIDATFIPQQCHLAEEEAERVEPRQENSAHNLLDTLLAETEIIAADDGGIDQKKPAYLVRLHFSFQTDNELAPDGVGAIQIHDEGGIRIVLLAFAHLLAITIHGNYLSCCGTR
jgi:hypothetical protein